MVHGARQDYRRGTNALGLECLRVLERNEAIPLPVHEESRTLHLVHDVDIPESIIHDVLQQVSCLFSNNVPN